MPGSVAPLDLAGVQIPYHFRCPISLELMRDPVTVSTGQTYDRCSIESWVATGNTTCPVTRVALTDFTLIPNHTLRRLIQEWCVAHRSLGVERIPTPKQPADPALARSLVAQSAAASGSVASRLAALRRLHALARDSDKNRHVISTPENRAALLTLAFDGGGGDDLALESLGVISTLPLSEQESSSVASRPDRLTWLCSILSSHPFAETRIDAAAMIEAVSAGTRSPDLRIAIGRTEGLIEALVRMLESESSRPNPRAVKVAIRAVFSLCLVKENREIAVAAGAGEALVDRVFLGGLDRGDLERALAAVELLCRVEGGCDALVGRKGRRTVAAMVGVMAGKVSDRAAEHAAGALAVVCAASEELQGEAVARGVLVWLLLMVQSDCTERAKRKAQTLLKMLRAAWPHHDSLANSDDFQVHPPAAAAATATATFLR